MHALAWNAKSTVVSLFSIPRPTEAHFAINAMYVEIHRDSGLGIVSNSILQNIAYDVILNKGALSIRTVQ